MMNYFKSMKLAATVALLCAPLALAAQTTPLRSYSTSGTENLHTYDPATGWTDSVQTFTGTFDLLTTTDARLTKVYANGTTVVRDLVLHWTVDQNAPVQGGTAAELSDATDPVVKRTTYQIGLEFDGLRYTMVSSFTTRAYLSIIGYYQWYNVAYGDIAGAVVSPVGYYQISGSEKSGKTTTTYTGTFALTSSTTAQLTRIAADGSSTTVDLALQTPVDLEAASQTITAVQAGASSAVTTYTVNLNLNGISYDVDCTYSMIQVKGKTVRTTGTGIFLGSQQ